jgi:dihydroorotate dehydrogenase
MRHVYAHADYITINISSPNTPGLRELQHGEGLSSLLLRLKKEQSRLAGQFDRYVPLVVKIAPDLSDEEIEDIAKRLLSAHIDGVIATNTTNSRPPSLHEKTLAEETGGLSGVPVFEISTSVLRKLVSVLGDQIPIIAAGGISSAEDALKKIDAGASLVQIYTGFIYSGPSLVNACSRRLADR